MKSTSLLEVVIVEAREIFDLDEEGVGIRLRSSVVVGFDFEGCLVTVERKDDKNIVTEETTQTILHESFQNKSKSSKEV